MGHLLCKLRHTTLLLQLLLLWKTTNYFLLTQTSLGKDQFIHVWKPFQSAKPFYWSQGLSCWDSLGKSFTGGDTSRPEAFVKHSVNEQWRSLDTRLIFSSLHNWKYPFSCVEGRKMKESLGSNLSCCFGGEESVESLPLYRFSRNTGSMSVSWRILSCLGLFRSWDESW